MKVTFTTSLLWGMLDNIFMVISILSDRSLSNLAFHLHRQFSSRFDIDHLSIWFVNFIKKLGFFYKITKSLLLRIEMLLFYILLHHKFVFQRSGFGLWNQWNYFSFSIKSLHLNKPQEFGLQMWLIWLAQEKGNKIDRMGR